MILTERQKIIDIPADQVASIAVVLPPAGPIRCRQALTKVTPEALAACRNQGLPIGTPSSWSWTEDNKVDIWPAPHEPMAAEIRDRSGQDWDKASKRIELPPVESIVSAISREHEAWQKQNGEPVRVERFSLLGDE